MVYPMDEGFYTAMQADTRDIDLFLSVGVNIDQTAADDYTGVTSAGLPFSNPAQLVDAVYNLEPGLSTFESYGIKTSADAGMIAPPIGPTAYPPECGYWSDIISDANGTIDWTIQINLSSAHTSALTLFTRGPSIVEATAEFRKDGAVVESGTMAAGQNLIQYENAVTFDSAVIHITKIDAPYHHVRICEVEFGASRSFSSDSFTGSVAIVTESDPIMTSIPLYELDFKVINVEGNWDADNPAGDFNVLPPAYPIEACITCYDGVRRWSVPLGRFIVSEKTASETELSVVCYDPRVALRDTAMSWAISADESLGTQITALLEDLHIPHEVQDEVFTVMPEAFTSGEDTTLLEVFLWIEQYYGVYLVPGRDGYVHVMQGEAAGEYGDIVPDMEYTYPLPYGFSSYNVIQVLYGDESRQTYTQDFRASPSEIRSTLSIDNPMVKTLAKAQELAGRIRAKMYTQMVEMEWRTDCTLDIGDSVGFTGRWSDDATAYDVIYQELTFDGSLTARTRGIL